MPHLGVRHLDMPCPPQRVWRALVTAEGGAPPEPWREPPAVFATIGSAPAVDEEAIDAAELAELAETTRYAIDT